MVPTRGDRNDGYETEGQDVGTTTTTSNRTGQAKPVKHVQKKTNKQPNKQLWSEVQKLDCRYTMMWVYSWIAVSSDERVSEQRPV